MRLVRGSLLIRRRTSSPSTFGSFRSSSTTLGGRSAPRSAYSPVAKTNSSASAPSRTRWSLLARFSFFSARTVSSASAGLSSTRRISTASRLMLSSSLRRQREIEDGAAVDHSLGPHAPSVPLHDPLDDREADAGAFELLGAVEALEDPEELARVPHVETRPVVLDEVDRLALPATAADLDHRLGAPARELPGVADEVHEDLPDEPAVGERREQRSDVHARASLGIETPRLRDHRERQGGHVHAGLLETLPPHTREREQVVDQAPHLSCVFPHDAENPAAVVVQPRPVILDEDAREAVDRAQRGAKVVRHGVAERLQLLVRRRELAAHALPLGVELLEPPGVPPDDRGEDDHRHGGEQPHADLGGVDARVPALQLEPAEEPGNARHGHEQPPCARAARPGAG